MAVYFVRRASDGAIKIGYSKYVNERLQRLRNEHYPDALTLLHFVKGEVLDEHDLQRYFASDHLAREWFRAGERLLATIETLRTTTLRAWLRVHPTPPVRLPTSPFHRRCGACRGGGHNVRTCTLRREAA